MKKLKPSLNRSNSTRSKRRWKEKRSSASLFSKSKGQAANKAGSSTIEAPNTLKIRLRSKSRSSSMTMKRSGWPALLLAFSGPVISVTAKLLFYP